MKELEILNDIKKQGFTRNGRTISEISEYVRDIYKCSYFVSKNVAIQLDKEY